MPIASGFLVRRFVLKQVPVSLKALPVSTMSCPDCVRGHILPGEPTGSTTNISGLSPAYFAAAPNASGPTKSAVLLLTDVFGLPLKNSKIIADRFASSLDVDVWVPDMFDGDPPFEDEKMHGPEKAGENMGFWGWVMLIWMALPRIRSLYRSRPSVAEERVKKVSLPLFLRNTILNREFIVHRDPESREEI
jgi:hypothetical protein